MVDSIGVWIPEARAPLDRLEGVRPIRGEGRYCGQLEGLRVSQETGGVWIKGSLPKYLLGNNALPLTRQSFREALGKLEGQTGLDLHAGIVRQMETASTLPVKEAPANYMASWGPLPRHTRIVYAGAKDGSVTYATKSRSFKGYDKGKETAPDALPVPLEGLFALRLEMSIKKGMKRIYGHPMTPWELAETEAYGQLVKAWGSFYFRIPKRREVTLSLQGMTPKRYERTLAALGLYALGMDRAEEIIRGGVQAGQVDKLTASRMRALLRELNADSRVTIAEALTEEVDAKVRAVTRYAR